MDDAFKKTLEQQEALRRAIDPLGDLHQKIKAASDPLARADLKMARVHAAPSPAGSAAD
jgi:hypothetical protein